MTDQTDFPAAFADACSAAAAVREGGISAEELTRHTLARIERFNPALNALVTPLADSALAQARQADAARAAGAALGPLHGVPVTIKDVYAVAGARTTLGLPELAGNVCAQDATAVARLRAAGAVILGLTNVPPDSADWITRNTLFGQTANPWDAARTPGGSSGGCAAAVAAGLSYLSLGSDIAGSIRIPAHFCGLFGHKPSIDVIPLTGTMPRPALQPAPLDNMLCTAGLLARSAEDLALGLTVAGGPDGDAARAWRWQLPPPRAARLRDYRIGFVLDDAHCPPTAAVRERLDAAVEALAAAGATLREGWPPDIDARRQFDIYSTLLGIGLHGDLGQRPIEELQQLQTLQPPTYQSLHARLLLEPIRELLAAQRRRNAVRAVWRRYFREYDAFLLPAAFTTAVTHGANLSGRIDTPSGARPYADLLFWNAAATLTGQPATVAPVGLAEGLPVGIQVMAPAYEDATGIDIAGHITALLGGAPRPAAYWQ